MHIFARLRKVARTPPLRDRLKHRTVRFSPAIDIGLAGWLKQVALRMARQCPESLRCIGRPESRQPDIGHRPAEGPGCNLKAIEV